MVLHAAAHCSHLHHAEATIVVSVDNAHLAIHAQSIHDGIPTVLTTPAATQQLLRSRQHHPPGQRTLRWRPGWKQQGTPAAHGAQVLMQPAPQGRRLTATATTGRRSWDPHKWAGEVQGVSFRVHLAAHDTYNHLAAAGASWRVTGRSGSTGSGCSTLRQGPVLDSTPASAAPSSCLLWQQDTNARWHARPVWRQVLHMRVWFLLLLPGWLVTQRLTLCKTPWQGATVTDTTTSHCWGMPPCCQGCVLPVDGHSGAVLHT